MQVYHPTTIHSLFMIIATGKFFLKDGLTLPRLQVKCSAQVYFAHALDPYMCVLLCAPLLNLVRRGVTSAFLNYFFYCNYLFVYFILLLVEWCSSLLYAAAAVQLQLAVNLAVNSMRIG